MPGPLDVLPLADGVGLPWDVPVDDAVEAIAAARAACGDSFVVRSAGSHYLFTFSPTGVESFYALPEDAASKGVADYLILRRNCPTRCSRDGGYYRVRCSGAMTCRRTWVISSMRSTRRRSIWANAGRWSCSR
ncbi:MAG TPA: hypothetical protein VET27_06700 [Mycobacterium sp.]|nr:hypothetical protein [Mycobacterium sp.]